MTILFSVLLVFTTQSVSAEDRATGSSSGLAIPVELIAIPVIIISLIALGYLAKNYSRFRYHTANAIDIEPAPLLKSAARSSKTQEDYTDALIKQDTLESKETNKQEQAKIITLPEEDGKMEETPSIPEESPVPKEYKILQIMAYVLIVLGLILKFINRQKNK